MLVSYRKALNFTHSHTQYTHAKIKAELVEMEEMEEMRTYFAKVALIITNPNRTNCICNVFSLTSVLDLSESSLK